MKHREKTKYTKTHNIAASHANTARIMLTKMCQRANMLTHDTVLTWTAMKVNTDKMNLSTKKKKKKSNATCEAHTYM